MARIVDLDGHELKVRFTGLCILRNRRRELRVPRTAIRSISTAPFARPGRIRRGAHRIDGRRYFLAYDDPTKTITVELDRAESPYPYDVLVLGV
jgi:hypothetical protein